MVPARGAPIPRAMHRLPRPLLALALLGLMVAPSPALAQELANDGYVEGVGTAGFQAGFVAGEMFAARFTPTAPGELTRIRMLFGGAPGLSTVTVHVWEDTGALEPGAEVYTGDFEVSRDDIGLQVLELTGLGVLVAGPFRVGVEVHAGGLPSIARDDDGTITAASNLAFLTPGGWMLSTAIGLMGDWILRATVTPAVDAGVSLDAGAAVDASVELDASTSTDAGAAIDAPSSGCRSNADCDLGQYCGEGGVCSFDCRLDSDCASGATCNTLGRCVASAPPASGCSCRASSRGPGALALVLGAALAGAVRRRARARR